MKLRRMAGALLLPVAFAAACNLPTNEVVEQTPEPVQSELADSKWVLRSLYGNPLIAETEISLSIERDRLTGSAGCNAYGGAYISSGQESLSIPEIEITGQDCIEPEGVMVQEEVYEQALRAVQGYRLREDRLELLDDTGRSILIFEQPAEIELQASLTPEPLGLGYWSAAVDERTGLHFVVPCFWQVLIPAGDQDPSGQGSITVRNYDDAFVQAHPRGAISEQEGAVKLDLTYIEPASLGLEAGVALSEFVNTLAPPGDSVVEAIEPRTINSLEAAVVTQRNAVNEATGQFAVLALQPDLYLVVGGAGPAFASADVQAILDSLSLSEPVLPNLMPADPPLGVDAPCLKGQTGPVSEDLTGRLQCTSPESSDASTFACGIQAALLQRDLEALAGFMSDPFTIGYWGSEAAWANPSDSIRELDQSRLPADTASLTFTIDQALFPPLAGTPPELMFGPDPDVALIIYSEGWGPDGRGSAVLYITVDDAGALRLSHMIYSHQHFDR